MRHNPKCGLWGKTDYFIYNATLLGHYRGCGLHAEHLECEEGAGWIVHIDRLHIETRRVHRTVYGALAAARFILDERARGVDRSDLYFKNR